MSSGIQMVYPKIEFKSPVSGGQRVARIGYSWQSGGQSAEDGKLAVYWIYAYTDELTTSVLAQLCAALDSAAARTGREILHYPVSDDGRNLNEVKQSMVKNTEQSSRFFTGFGPMRDRLERR